MNLRHTIMAGFEDAVFDKADLLHLPMIPIPVPAFDDFDDPGSAAFMNIISRWVIARGRPIS